MNYLYFYGVPFFIIGFSETLIMMAANDGIMLGLFKNPYKILINQTKALKVHPRRIHIQRPVSSSNDGEGRLFRPGF